MTLAEKIAVECSGIDCEDLYFMQQEQEKLKKLRESAEKESSEQYRDEHTYHCFRCGTASLVEVDHDGVKIDVCVNDGCGAVHLDPGEMEGLIKSGATTIKRVQLAIFNCFK